MPAALLSDVGVRASCITVSLHTANQDATEKVCSDGNAHAFRLRHSCGMSDVWNNHIAYWRKQAKMSQDHLAAAVDPPTTKGTISQYESGKRAPSQRRLADIAEALGRSVSELLDGPQLERPTLPEGAEPVESIPILGEVPAGNMREAVRDYRGWTHLAAREVRAGMYALQVSGDSMDKIVQDGALIIIDPNDRDTFHRRLFVVRGPDGEVTFKRYFDGPGRLEPCSRNPAHRTIPITDHDYEIVGRVTKIILDPDQAPTD